VLSPAFISGILFLNLSQTIQMGELAGGISMLFTMAGLGLGFILWVIGIVCVLVSSRAREPEIDIMAYQLYLGAGGIAGVAGLIGMWSQGFRMNVYPEPVIDFNGVFLSALSAYSGMLMLLTGIAHLRCAQAKH
jgi:hypothetical protein